MFFYGTFDCNLVIPRPLCEQTEEASLSEHINTAYPTLVGCVAL